MPSVLDPVLLGVIATLNAHVGVAALVNGRVFDTLAPPGTLSPYVVLNSPTEGAWDAFGRRGNRNTLALHIWNVGETVGSGEVSSRVAQAVYREINDALDLKPVAVGGSTYVMGTVSHVTGQLEDDKITYHGVARFEALTRT